MPNGKLIRLALSPRNEPTLIAVAVSSRDADTAAASLPDKARSGCVCVCVIHACMLPIDEPLRVPMLVETLKGIVSMGLILGGKSGSKNTLSMLLAWPGMYSYAPSERGGS